MCVRGRVQAVALHFGPTAGASFPEPPDGRAGGRAAVRESHPGAALLAAVRAPCSSD